MSNVPIPQSGNSRTRAPGFKLALHASLAGRDDPQACDRRRRRRFRRIDDEASLNANGHRFSILAERPAFKAMASRSDDERVRAEIGRRERRSRPGEIGRGGDENATDRADPARDGGAVAKRSNAHGDVDRLADEIMSGVIQRKLDAELWMLPGEARQARQDGSDRKGGRRRHLQRTAQFAGAARRMIGLVKSGEDRLGPGEIVGAGLGEGHGPCAARQERRPDLSFERRHDPRRGRLRHAHLARRGRETAAAGDAHEKLHRDEPVAHTEIV